MSRRPRVWQSKQTQIVTNPKRKNNQREAKLYKVVRRSLSSFGANRYYMIRVDSNESGAAGFPDFMGHIFGLMVGIECKVHKNYVEEAQKRELGKINATGGLGVVLVWIPKDETYWLVLPEYINSFSYREQTGWQQLRSQKVNEGAGEKVVLDLTALYTLVIQRLMERDQTHTLTPSR